MLFHHSQFNSREELIWAVVGSICVPFVFIRDFPIKCGEDVSSCSCSISIAVSDTIHIIQSCAVLMMGSLLLLTSIDAGDIIM